MITPAEAFATAEAHVRAERFGVRVERLLEDDRDYLAVLELVPSHTEWILGPGFVFVSKATGKLRLEPPSPKLLDRIDGMIELGGYGS